MNLKIISLIITLIGITFLLLLTLIIPAKQQKIKEINKDLLEKRVIITGQIISSRNYNNFQILSVKDATGKIDVTIDSNIKLKINQTIKIQGTVDQYKNNIQIRANKIS